MFAGGLQPPDTATVVRIEHDNAVLTDGPFTESKEHIGGFWVIEVADLDAALSCARRAARNRCSWALAVRARGAS